MSRTRPLVLLQTSDWHVGSPLTGRGLGLPPELRERRREAVDSAAEKAVAAAREAGADALLVPGDLWDAESVPPSAIHRLLEALQSFAPSPVYVAPGNHDFCAPGSWYDPALLGALGMRSWPENVFVFRSFGWDVFPFPGRDDVAVVGRACPSPTAIAERPLAPPPPHPGTSLSVLLLHGSLETYGGRDRPVGDKRTAPFTRDELLAAGFTWAALGHHHHLQVVEDDSGVPRAAYSGTPTGRGLDEAGPRSFLKVTLDEESVTVEPVPADPASVREVEVDIGDLETGRVLERVQSRLAEERVRSEDLVCLTLTGAQPYGARPASALRPLVERLQHLVLRDRTSPPASDAPSSRTAEGRFLAELAERRARATDERSVRVIDLALSLGRDALAGRVLEPPDAED